MKFLLDVIPIVIFFFFYKFFNLTYATAAIIVTSILSLLITYVLERRISFMALFSCLLLSFFGGLTIFSGNSVFIKIKPTIINLLFSAILLIGVYYKKGFIKSILGSSFKLDEKIWIIISFRWGIFFLFLAMLNEIIWRNFSEGFWVNFKVFGLSSLMMVFLITQLSFISKNAISENKPM
jgi:intracellular septation protein